MALTPIRVIDLVRAAAGWPIDVDAVIRVLAAADRVLAAEGGQDCERELTEEEICEMGFSI